MFKTFLEAMLAVDEINTNMLNNITLKDEQLNSPYLLIFTTNGVFASIGFMGRIIWDSDNDKREWAEGVDSGLDAHYIEPFLPFLLKQINIVLNETEIVSSQILKTILVE